MDAGLLPVKRFDRAKNRLAGRFNAPARAEIAAALFEDALALLAEADFLRWWVVSDDERILGAAAGAGFNTVRDEGTGLNDALGLGVAKVIAAGATSVTVIPSDVPLAAARDLVDLVDTGATSDVVVVPAEDGGTNGLYLSPPDLLPPLFGPGSLRAHLRAAETAGVRCALLSLPRLALDIDTADDIRRFLSGRNGAGRTAEVLKRLGSA